MFSVFQNELEPTSDEWVDIYFDLLAEENIQESTFLALAPEEVDPDRHFPVKTFLDSIAYRKATEPLSDDLKIKIDNVQDKFRTYLIPNEIFESDDRNKVAIVFKRINRAGTELNIFELLAAWSWSDQFDLVERFEDLQGHIAHHGFDELCNDRAPQLRICAGIITGETTPKSILDLQGEEIRARFSEIENGILGALDFIKREIGICHYKLIPFPGLLVPLSAFFATDRAEGQPVSDKQREVIIRWFWRSVFSRRFSANVNKRQSSDIQSMVGLKANEDVAFKQPKAEVNFDFAKANFSSGNANSQSLIILLNQLGPRSLLSGSAVDLDKVLKKSSRHEYHHVFPQKHLDRKGYERKTIKFLRISVFSPVQTTTPLETRLPICTQRELPTKSAMNT